MTIFIGIAPGLTGAWAAINERGDYITMSDLPTVATGKGQKVQRQIDPASLARDLAHIAQDSAFVALEKTSAMPGQGVASMFSMGDSFGAIRAAVAIKSLACELVPSATWKRAMGLDSDKERCRAKAIQLFPKASVMLARKRDHNRSEALLLAEWLRRKMA